MPNDPLIEGLKGKRAQAAACLDRVEAGEPPPGFAPDAAEQVRRQVRRMIATLDALIDHGEGPPNA